MSHKVWKAFFLLLLAVIVTSGVVSALMLRQTDRLVNNFDAAYVSCQVAETFDGDQKTSIKVKNTSNIDAYLRVRLVTYWVDEEDKISAKLPSESISFTANEGWISGGDNTWYYSLPVASEGFTPDLLASVLILKEDEGTGLRQVVEVFAEAIQSKPAKAVAEAWGMYVDENGRLTTTELTT